MAFVNGSGYNTMNVRYSSIGSVCTTAPYFTCCFNTPNSSLWTCTNLTVACKHTERRGRSRSDHEDRFLPKLRKRRGSKRFRQFFTPCSSYSGAYLFFFWLRLGFGQFLSQSKYSTRVVFCLSGLQFRNILSFIFFSHKANIVSNSVTPQRFFLNCF